ncbi:MAG TPA: MBL fold metallo-hydrolase [Gemmatimonadaceae bacterium]|nr:MBL fold metallo-hydrolase [Gemmatimonadaceae bacterium]
MRHSLKLFLASLLLVAACALDEQQAQTVVAATAAPPTLRIIQIDVGQADAALITTPEGKRILIDAGANYASVATALRSQRIDTIDLVIASHNHADHIGGMPGVLAAAVVRAYLDNGIAHTTAAYRSTLAAVQREPGLRYLTATERTITVGSVRVRVLGLPGVDSSQNNNSVGVIIEYGKFSALYTGDSELAELGAWIRAGKIPKVSMVKAAHHGSWNGWSEDLVRAASPKIVVVSVATPNGYGHPAPRVVNSWLASGAKVYRTDRDGDIEIAARTDGTFTVRTSRAPAAQRQ